MEGNPAHKAAIRLAEEGIYVGQYMNGHYFFDPKQPVSRAQFLGTMGHGRVWSGSHGGCNTHRLL